MRNILTKIKSVCIVMSVILSIQLASANDHEILNSEQANIEISTVSVNQKPNFIIILTDDQGYGDVGAYGATGFSTPNIDNMASEGIKFTDFYTLSPNCTPSRSALITGRYPRRVGLHEGVLRPYSTTGLSTDEVTIAEVLKERGYQTGCIGKWHLGHMPQFMPNSHGFDYFYGVPYSHDMDDCLYKDPPFLAPPLPVYENENVIESGPKQKYLTKRWTDAAVSYIRENKEKPFFLYLAHNMPHTPWAASEAFRGSSSYGLYGDVIQEIDWSVGEILKTLRETGLDSNTVVLFASDNGPKKETNGGSAGILRGYKSTTWEGGLRVPFIAWGPNYVEGGKNCSELVTLMDFLPTLVEMTGDPSPLDHTIDGHSIVDLLKNPQTAQSAYDEFYYHASNGRLEAIRVGDWKLHKYKKGWDGPLPLLYNLKDDVGEENNLADSYPEIVNELEEKISKFNSEMSSVQPLFGTYTIGQTGDYKSFNAAVTALSKNGVSGPVIFNVEAETFEEQLGLTKFPGMTAENTVTFRGHSSGNSTITYSPTDPNIRHVILLFEAKYFVFDNLNIVIGPEATYGTGMLLMNSSNSNIVKNCHIEINNASNTKDFNGVLANTTTSGYLDEGNNANKFTFENNTVKGGYNGLRLNGSPNKFATGNKIRNNHFSDHVKSGIYMDYQDAPEVTDNLVESSSLTEELEMHHLELRYCDNDFNVLRNRIRFKSGIGLYVYHCNKTATTSMTNRGLVANNFISQDGLSNSSERIWGVRTNHSSNIDWVHNSINMTEGDSDDYAFWMSQGNADYTGYSLVNNCFVSSGGGIAVYIHDNISSSEDFDFDYNNYYTTGSVLAYWGGDKADLDAFKSSYDNVKNQHSVSMDPIYPGVHDLHTGSLQFCELGIPFGRVNEDIDGDARSETTPDIGADEYNSLTNSSDETKATLKGDYLRSCQPNPMSEKADISFKVAKKCHVKIVLFNNFGQLVRVLENNDFQPGAHSVKFNKLNLLSGLYFLTMYSNEIIVDTKKIVISE